MYSSKTLILSLLVGVLTAFGCDSGSSDNGGGGGNGSGGIAGLWKGTFGDYEVCFYVNQAGTQLTPSSECDVDQVETPANPFSYEIRVGNSGTDQDGGNCGFGLGYEENVPISNNSFSVSDFSFPNSQDVFAFDGTISGNTASGKASRTFEQFSCTIDWMATKVGGGNGGGGSGGSGTGGSGGSGTGGSGGSTGGGIKAGLWSGTDVCLFVNDNGTRLVPSSRCDLDPQQTDSYLFDWQPSSLQCGISFPQDDEPQSIRITDGEFSYSGFAISFEGTFDGNSVSGTASTPGCSGDNEWSATAQD